MLKEEVLIEILIFQLQEWTRKDYLPFSESLNLCTGRILKGELLIRDEKSS